MFFRGSWKLLLSLCWCCCFWCCCCYCCWCCCCGPDYCYWLHPIHLCSINVHLGLLQPDIEFVWRWGGGCIFMSNPAAVLRLRLCCVVIWVVPIFHLFTEWNGTFFAVLTKNSIYAFLSKQAHIVHSCVGQTNYMRSYRIIQYHICAYITIQDCTRPHETLEDHTWPQRTTKENKELYMTVKKRDHTGQYKYTHTYGPTKERTGHQQTIPFKTLQDSTGPHMNNHSRPYRTIQDHTYPYKTTKNHTRPQKVI